MSKQSSEYLNSTLLNEPKSKEVIMGKFLKKTSKSNDSKAAILNGSKTEDLTKKLYKPINEFSWKNASPAELHHEALPHYAEKFAI